MSYFLIIPSYVYWHYTEALRDIARVWTNFLWFLYNFFSVSLLTRTLFAPWQRISEKRTRTGLHMEDIAEVVVTNTIMRAVGALLRFILIVVGVLSVLIAFWAGLLFYVLWILLPALIPVSFFYGLSIFVS
ncbi:MAG: hypothetical protein A3C06_04585 [Candidatus Taylorbacteria bacterium RIFCSPHIGHO2_02_FULL_46_13]|uniref:Uncharacterized protein n=1 Tax=Candidatus Taylorbacteria bacterium RIFCSPHIGHO2_02_FULL_46_13 TaxID=1802312 RepID=A0A1G2MQR3_9BACT|nr:MAG: hypothetical protein A3C06_04585 [Candidatus Taylorbacteria bacterium RIFCSPHIGHO2_02_FULL_46_13]